MKLASRGEIAVLLQCKDVVNTAYTSRKPPRVRDRERAGIVRDQMVSGNPAGMVLVAGCVLS